MIANMRVLMTEDSNSAVSNSFLLDDDSRFESKAFLLGCDERNCAGCGNRGTI